MAGGGVLDVFNMALSHLDLSKTVESTTDTTPQAGYCNRFWDRARRMVLEQCYWTVATVARPLSLLLDQSTVSINSQMMPGWQYVYARPTDCLKAQAVTDYIGLRQSRYMSYWWMGGISAQFNGPRRPPWTEMLDQVNSPPGQSVDILTDQINAWLVYTVDPPNLGILPEVMLDAFSWRLATLIAGPASANQKAKEMAEKMAELSLTRALAQNLNEQQPDQYPESPSIQVRI